MTKPQTIDAVARLASFDIDNDDVLVLTLEVIQSLGFDPKDFQSIARIVRLLHSCLGRYLWTWESLGCEPPGPRPAFKAVGTWLQTGALVEGFANHCFPVAPIRDGEEVYDCDEPALRDLSNASARLAYFCVTRNAIDAALVLSCLFWADAESLQADDGMGLLDWLSTKGVQLAWPDK